MKKNAFSRIARVSRASVSLVLPVIRITSSLGSRPFKRAISSKPSISGMRMSMIARSNGAVSSSSSACCGVSAERTSY